MNKRIHCLSGLVLLAALFVASCVQPSVLGPAPPVAGSIVEIRVTDLKSTPSKVRSIDDRQKIASLINSYAVGPNGWIESGRRELPATYRVDFINQGGLQATYWLGLNGDLGIFPCYAICSGWWIAPSSAAGTIDSSRYKGLTSTMSLYLFNDLAF
jgi:hypothetical protein